MNSKVISSDQFHTRTWSGGKTTQLHIHPEDAKFSNHDFDFRISTASIEEEETTFTRFENYQRKILILDGEIQLFHKGQQEILLKKFETSFFEGSWETTSKGKAKDFNVIFSQGIHCDLMPATSEQGVEFNLEISQGEYLFIYIVHGELSFLPDQTKLNPGTLLFVRADFMDEAVPLKSDTYAEWVFVKIKI